MRAVNRKLYFVRNEKQYQHWHTQSIVYCLIPFFFVTSVLIKFNILIRLGQTSIELCATRKLALGMSGRCCFESNQFSLSFKWNIWTNLPIEEKQKQRDGNWLTQLTHIWRYSHAHLFIFYCYSPTNQFYAIIIFCVWKLQKRKWCCVFQSNISIISLSHIHKHTYRFKCRPGQ